MGKKTRNILILAAIAVLLVIALVVCMNVLKVNTTEGSKAITVQVTHTDGTEKELRLRTDAEYLWGALEPTGLFSGEEGSYGLMLDTIDGELADGAEGAYWMFTVNGEYSNYGVSEAPVADGDVYEFFIEVY